MNSCLNNIVSVSDPCSEEKSISTSGYDLLDAPEINLSNISQIAGSDTPNGYQFLIKQRDLALKDVVNDFIGVLNTNNLITQLHKDSISTGKFNSFRSNPANQKQGITIHRNMNGVRGNTIKKLIIRAVLIYPKNSHSSTNLYIQEGSEVTAIPIELIGGRINKFTINYASKNNERVSIYLDNIETYSSELTCLVGCGGSLPNSCGFVKGYNNGSEVQREGFGINAEFGCDCDYESLLCRYSQGFVGNIVFLKARSRILQERIHNDRINSFIIYGREEAKELYTQVENEYREAWNAFLESIPNLLAYDEDCINCRRVKLVVNV